MINCRVCNKEYEDKTSTLCPDCREKHKSMNWADLLRMFVTKQKTESSSDSPHTQNHPKTPYDWEVKNTNKTTTSTIDEILSKSGYHGYGSLSEEELKILGDHRDKMLKNRGI